MNPSIPSLPQGVKPHRGTMILVFGILSLVLFLVGSLCCFPLFLVGLIMGIVAWVFAVPDLKEMDSGIMDPTGRGGYQGRHDLRHRGLCSYPSWNPCFRRIFFNSFVARFVTEAMTPLGVTSLPRRIPRLKKGWLWHTG